MLYDIVNNGIPSDELLTKFIPHMQNYEVPSHGEIIDGNE